MRKKSQEPIHPQQQAIRGMLRVIGPCIVGVGILFLLVGGVDFFSKAGSGGIPTKFWCLFVGLPLLALGGALTRFGFMGAVARYTAGEYAPVAKDTVNYMAEGTSDAVKTVARAVREGLGGDSEPSGTRTLVRCHKCNEENETDAKYCSQCGAALLKAKPCPQCGEQNDPDARFCDNCGHAYSH